ncbi:rod shape-determining protein RodA [Eggerthellaceae bacterium zg-1084]|uniref:Rod shape-determining protein RodA n=1 Tax=Berryella wangjianweii TaxID=2734634 RepID=A0A6M8J2D5_9ACTN|nr:FtsW/RodA/SpoVE family cell cycle protein [Berryella wangjianweii]NPD30622.1 rod shape-determining protein RodA [Berryella wangjianweii]NPD32160.1 rod shape-determining protein RodA [Eggerthellaceae bacterium zg-997]QKF07271.1 rod shape-determining protein RodA [Berryella wangjianweii]
MQVNQIHTVRTAVGSGEGRRASSRTPRRVLWPFVAVVAALVSFGLMVVYSAVSSNPDYSFTRQLAGVAVGAVVMAVTWHFDYTRLAGFRNVFLIVNVLLILSPHLPVIGVNTMGATSWINIGMQVQPGEFAKVTVVLLDAALMAPYQGRLDDARAYLKTVGLMLVPFACIMTQPDLGTGLVYLAIGATSLVMGGANRRFLLISLAVGVALVALVFAVDEAIKDSTGEYKLLKQYQRNRLLVFLDQGSTNASKEGYNLNQAMIAIGSGGLFGQGYLQGSQHSLGILPEAPTDFIFCVLAEELGFLGALCLLVLYMALLVCCFFIARRSCDVFGALIVMGVVGMWLFQILENIGMTCGLMPITGIPLPFMSYGSSFMVVNFALLGLVGSVWAHNKQNARRVGYAATR